MIFPECKPGIFLLKLSNGNTGKIRKTGSVVNWTYLTHCSGVSNAFEEVNASYAKPLRLYFVLSLKNCLEKTREHEDMFPFTPLKA